MKPALSLAEGFEVCIVLVLFILALLPRVLNLDAFITWDEPMWVYRSIKFLTSLRRMDGSCGLQGEVGRHQTSHRLPSRRRSGVNPVLSVQDSAREMVLGQLLNLMTSFQQVRPINPQFCGQMIGWHSLDNAAHDEDDGDTLVLYDKYRARVAAFTPNGVGEDVEHIAAHSTHVDKDRVSVSVMGSLIRRQGMTIAAM